MVADIKPRCCGVCAPCSGNFKKVVDLPYSGLVIYVHRRADEQDDSVFIPNAGIIFHNTSNKEINKPKYIHELSDMSMPPENNTNGQYKTEYNHIKIIIKRVRSLLDEIVVIKGNQIIGICEHCKRANTTKQCKRCDFMVKQFLTDRNIGVNDKHQRFKEWLLKVKQLLQSILNAHSVCKHMAYKDTELERILKELKTPLSIRVPDIDFFPNIESDQLMTQSITESKEMLDELLSRIQSEGLGKPRSSNDSLYPSPSDYKETCICKLVKEGHHLESEISALSIGKSESLSETNLKTYSKMLITDVLQRLLDLKRALILDEFKYADKGLIQNLIKNISHVNKHGLLPESAKLLIEQITELSKALLFDEKASSRHKELIDGLLAELKKCKIMTEGFSKHLLKVLVDVCKKTADDLSSDTEVVKSKRQSYTKHSKSMSQQNLRKRSTPMVSTDSRPILPKHIQDRKEKIEVGYKKSKTSLPDISSKEVVPGLKEVPKTASKILPKQTSTEVLKDEHKEGRKALSKDATSRILKGDEKIIPKDTTSQIVKDGPKEGKRAVPKETASRILKDEPKYVERALPKDIPTRIFKDGAKEGEKPLLRDTTSGILKDTTSRILKDTTSRILKDTTSIMIKDVPKEGEKAVPKDKVSRIVRDESKESKEVGRALPKEIPSRILKDGSKDDGKLVSKEAATKLKGELKEESKVIVKDSVSRSTIDRQKELKKVSSKGSTSTKDEPKELKQLAAKDVHKGDHKEISQASPVDQSLEITREKQEAVEKSLPKKLTEIPPKDKLKDVGRPKESVGLSKTRNKDEQKDAGDEKIKQRLLELGRALSQGLSQALDKELVRQVTGNLKNAITKDTRNVTKDVIEALSDVCKVLTKGIPKNLNKGPVIDLLEEMNEVFVRGLSSDQNKEKLQTKLRELEKALIQTIPIDKTKSKPTTTEEVPTKDDSAPAKSKKEDLAKYAQEAQKKVQLDKEKKGKESKDKPKQSIDGKKSEQKEVRIQEEKPKKEAINQKLGKETDKEPKDKQPEKRKSDLLFQKLLSERKQTKEKEQAKEKDKKAKETDEKRAKALQLLASLPKLKTMETESPTESSEISMHSQVEIEPTKYIVIGTTLQPYIPLQKEPVIVTHPPILFKNKITLENIEETVDAVYKQLPKDNTVSPKERTGMIKYQLSNRDFIDKGWTQLPTKKIMRRMNIYRMKPASPQYDWFKRNKDRKIMFYDSGERLAEIDDEGRGKWYYRNGSIALDYYNSEDMLVGQRYIVYSSGEECEGGRRKSATVLALFDYLGNGIVYDYNGNVRLKYNQSEGIVVDPKIGAPSRWKWHTLNEPPVLQQVFVNTRLAMRDPYIEQLGVNEAERPIDSYVKQAQTDMLQVELDNFVKEKSQKLMQQFKPFRIKMKAAKLNEQFSLKILDQSRITLIFRDGRTSLKLNLGMHLNNREIIDTDISDATEVSTPYDKFPAKSDSVANIQSILHDIRKANRPHHPKRFVSHEDFMRSGVSL